MGFLGWRGFPGLGDADPGFRDNPRPGAVGVEESRGSQPLLQPGLGGRGESPEDRRVIGIIPEDAGLALGAG